MKRQLEIEQAEARNKWFASLSAADKRVSIAKDVLESIRTRDFEPESGYLKVSKKRSAEIFPPYCDVQQTLLQEKGLKCEGCAIAAVFYSKIILGNGAVFTTDEDYNPELMFDDSEIHSNLDGIFTHKQLGMIEAAYELSSRYAIDRGVSRDIGVRCSDWGSRRHEKYWSHGKDERESFLKDFGYQGSFPHNFDYSNLRLMIDIMENIIRNKGRFRV